MTRVITYGTFDLFHDGHYKLLERAKQMGDYLIVGVTTEHFDEARGKVNVIDSIIDRIENVKRTGFADEIIIEDHAGQKIEDIQKYKIDIFTVGSDWIGTFDYLKAFCKVVYLERTPNISSTMIRKDRFRIIRMGIIGTGRIAPRFVYEAKYVSGIEVIAAYNPEENGGTKFHKATRIDVCTKDFQSFLQRIDAVYVASPNETHYEYVKQSLEAGKHVLSEKPIAFTTDQTTELYALAHRMHVVLLEGIKTAYCPGFQQLMNVARSGKIGDICAVEACFTRLADINSRERTDANYGGSFLEFGGYTLLPIMKLMGLNYKEIRMDCIYGENGVDMYTNVQLVYENGLAVSKNGVGVKSEGQLIIAGTKGYILAESPWWLTRKFEVRYEDALKIETYEPNFQGDGLRYEISEFIMKINGVGKNGYKLTAEESIAMSRITELFMRKRQENK